MTKAAVISARIDPELKKNTEQIFQELGLTTTQAITLFYKQVALQHGLPFAVKLPNEETQQALAEAKARYNLKSFDDTDTLFDDLDI
jgi:DNA-damage-inducible protein J